MPPDLSKPEQFLLKEHESAVTLTNHIDGLRNNLTRFYLTFSGVGAAAVLLLIKGEAKSSTFGDTESLMGFVALFVSLVGMMVARGLGRLRKVQLESFRIINNIRAYFIGASDYKLWNVVQLSSKTLPSATVWSGTYMWLFMVASISSALFYIALFLFLSTFVHGCLAIRWSAPLGGVLIFMLLQNLIYFRAARVDSEIQYSAENSPTASSIPPASI